MNIINTATQTIPKRAILGLTETEATYSTGVATTQKLLITAGETITLYDCLKVGSDGKAYKATNKVDYVALSPGAVGVQIEITKNKIIDSNLGAVGNLYLNYAAAPSSAFYQLIGVQLNTNLALIDIGEFYEIR